MELDPLNTAGDEHYIENYKNYVIHVCVGVGVGVGVCVCVCKPFYL